MKYEVGQQVWWPRADQRENSVECPDCGGTGRLRVTFHDDTTVSIACENCSIGYDPPTGRVKVYDRTPTAERVTITGFRVQQGSAIEYSTPQSYLIEEEKLFETREAAMECAALLATEADQRDRDKVFQKEKDTKSWAWNATYHRRQIKHAKKDLAYHEAKLAAADLKAKKHG